jgi:hypothetical protein
MRPNIITEVRFSILGSGRGLFFVLPSGGVFGIWI